MGFRTLFDESTGAAGIEDAKRVPHLVRCRTKDQSALGEILLLTSQADCPLHRNTKVSPGATRTGCAAPNLVTDKQNKPREPGLRR